MKPPKEVIKYFDKKKINFFLERLFKLPRSITGKGFRDSLQILGKIIDLKIIKIKSGTKVLDWIVPSEWNITDSYILTPDGKKIADFKKNNLHVVNYSIPIKKKITLDKLKKFIHTIPALPNAIPYVTSYYHKTWGFCLEYNKFKKLKKGFYNININSKFTKGNLIYSDTILPGKSKKQILISTYLCHPQMANHELSGPIATMILYDILKKTRPHNYSYRFLIAPENVGAAAFLHKNKRKIKKDIIAGFIFHLLANGKNFYYKKSRQGNSLADRAALNVSNHSKKKFITLDYSASGGDERQFCSPGFDLPVGSLSRLIPGVFKEYHNSLDNKDFFSSNTLIESLKKYYELILTIDTNFIPISKIMYGTPQLSRSKIHLYPRMMKFNSKKDIDEETRVLLEILNLADGKNDLIDIANKRNFKLINHIELIKKLLKSGYIRKK